MKFIMSVVACAVLAFASSASAQTTTTCPPGTNGGTVKTNTQFSFFWCAAPSPVITGAYVYGIAPTKQLLTNTRQVAGPFSDGLVQMQAEVVTGVPKGQYSITLTQTATDINFGGVVESGPSAPFALSAADPFAVPAPSNIRVK